MVPKHVFVDFHLAHTLVCCRLLHCPACMPVLKTNLSSLLCCGRCVPYILHSVSQIACWCVFVCLSVCLSVCLCAFQNVLSVPVTGMMKGTFFSLVAALLLATTSRSCCRCLTMLFFFTLRYVDNLSCAATTVTDFSLVFLLLVFRHTYITY